MKSSATARRRLGAQLVTGHESPAVAGCKSSNISNTFYVCVWILFAINATNMAIILEEARTVLMHFLQFIDPSTYA